MEKTSWWWEVQLLSWNINNVAGRKKKQQATSYIGCILKTSIKACCQQQESNNYKCCSVGRLSDGAPLFEILPKPCQHSVTFMVLHFYFYYRFYYSWQVHVLAGELRVSLLARLSIFSSHSASTCSFLTLGSAEIHFKCAVLDGDCSTS